MNNIFTFLLIGKRFERLSFIFLLSLAFIIFPAPFAAQISDKKQVSFQTPQAYLSGSAEKPPVSRARQFLYSKIESDLPKRPARNNASLSSTAAISRFEQQSFQILNRERLKYNLSTLAWSEKVAAVARMHSEDMARFGFLSHLGKDGSSVSERADMLGIRSWRGIGENIAYNQGFDNPVEFACQRWLISVKHRTNILDARFKETGIGVAVSQDGTYYFTQVFILR